MMKQQWKWLCLAASLLLLLTALYLRWQYFTDETAEALPIPINTVTAAELITVTPEITAVTPEFTTAVSESTAAASESTLIESATTPEDDALPHDKLFITVERQNYQDGDLTLILPKLEKELSVLNGITGEVLSKGVGLYDYAQLPGEGNRNVSIAGHRNGRKNGKVNDHAPFYYIDTLQAGDYLYLRDNKNIYRYLWESSEIIESDDWSPIYSQGFSCLTLTSCHPIGISDQRIIVRGRLDAIIPFDQNFEYAASAKEKVK